MSSWLSLEEALERALSIITPLYQTEIVKLHEACGRVLANDISAPLNVPPWDNSAMDGYAVNIQTDGDNSPVRTVTGVIAAGDLADIKVTPSTCIRIMTGAPIPEGANAVVIQENVLRKGDEITMQKIPAINANIRPCANDICQGDIVLEAGHEITPADLVLLSSLGKPDAEVIKKPRVAILATGSELAEPGQSCQEQQIFESNRAGLKAKLTQMHCDVIDVGIIDDDPELIKTTFARLAQSHDMVISSGGVSVGDADWVKPALSSLGQLHLWKIAIKPGKPFAFGQFGDCYFCGLPGNPVSAFVTFEQVATPLINKLRGMQLSGRLTVPARMLHSHRRRTGRIDFARGYFSENETGELEVTLFKNQSSGVMTSITKANCYVVLPPEKASIDAGEVVRIQPFSIKC